MRIKPKAGLSKFVRPLKLPAILVVVFLVGVGLGNGWIGRQLPGAPKPVAKGLPAQLDYSSVNTVYQSLKQNYNGQLTEGQLIDGLKHGLAQSTNDPYTEYFTAKEAQQFNAQLNEQFSGIGAELGQDSTGNLQVIAPIAGTPAAQAGLQAQDLIASINGVSTSGLNVDEAVSKIRGPAGTKVTLQVVRNHSQVLNLTITRQNITVPSVTTKILPGNIGYMQIATFANDTSDLAKKAADQFAGQHVKGIILDLRDDPGGLLDAADNVSNLWLNQGQTIVTTRGTSGNQTTAAQGSGNELHGIPTVVLINSGSASASEITTGALHDNKDAYVIGQKSYGKGVVQQLINYSDGSQLKVTIASWYRPNGQNINHRGITPDQAVKQPSGAISGSTTDAQLQAAEAYLAK
jgi:carboxyl-terminal processing protease